MPAPAKFAEKGVVQIGEQLVFPKPFGVIFAGPHQMLFSA
jgi:hypothetical protein